MRTEMDNVLIVQIGEPGRSLGEPTAAVMSCAKGEQAYIYTYIYI